MISEAKDIWESMRGFRGIAGRELEDEMRDKDDGASEAGVGWGRKGKGKNESKRSIGFGQVWVEAKKGLRVRVDSGGVEDGRYLWAVV